MHIGMAVRFALFLCTFHTYHLKIYFEVMIKKRQPCCKKQDWRLLSHQFRIALAILNPCGYLLNHRMVLLE